ncbi:MAG: LamB/YcsF family protein [Gordonia sp. (in: high G+C Gram-positive bacteria)]|nr:MAG: LamB/YcsF family protein [Gordonia sp. (in: high G+C Gram-positive bacteria)]
MTTIDLNSDIGESFGRWELGDDEAMLDLVTSANIACGFHAGDPSTIARTARWSVQRGVRIGAQVAYRDLAGFGRRFVDASRTELTDDVVYQIGGLQALAAAAGGTVTYVKPHGALYNTAVHHEEHATAVVDAVAAVDPGLAILGLPGSRLLELAEHRGLRVIREAFADRGYTPSATLVSRREPGAVLHDPDAVAERVLRMVSDGEVEAVDGSTVKLDVDSVCVHGDSPAAVEMARAVRDILGANSVEVNPFS